MKRPFLAQNGPKWTKMGPILAPILTKIGPKLDQNSVYLACSGAKKRCQNGAKKVPFGTILPVPPKVLRSRVSRGPVVPWSRGCPVGVPWPRGGARPFVV